MTEYKFNLKAKDFDSELKSLEVYLSALSSELRIKEIFRIFDELKFVELAKNRTKAVFIGNTLNKFEEFAKVKEIIRDDSLYDKYREPLK